LQEVIKHVRNISYPNKLIWFESYSLQSFLKIWFFCLKLIFSCFYIVLTCWC
jgi:hypothetical protein